MQDDEAGAGPQKAGVAVTDILTGLYATIGILAALSHRERTGIGQHIDIGLLDVQVACLANQAMNYLVSGSAPRRSGNAHPNLVPYQDFPTADGYMIIAVGNDAQFARSLRRDGSAGIGGRSTLRHQQVPGHQSPRIDRPIERRHRDPAHGRHWVAALEAVGVPAGPINSLDAVFADPQVRARAMQVELPHPVAGTVSLVANPLRLSETPVSYRQRSAAPGSPNARDSRASGWGCPIGDIEKLRAQGVI